ncbi:hypothetical protein FOL47_000710 [Perkinsus chesapeaki]|uniref:GPI inositol-deacylase n=1 Tax=Perkinsus chesapeaki TaxID=330153 RepID=A0A7J6KVR3_PERCH|nr:hypothetical protein FOL47_000710 [Perkinsus chesapeaki]
MWHVVRRGHRNADKGRHINEHRAALSRLHTLEDMNKQQTGKLWCEMGSSDEEDEDDRSTANVWDASSVSNELTPRSVTDVDDTKENGEQKSETAGGEPTTPSTSESWQEQHQIDKLLPHAPSLASGSVSTAEPSPVAAPSYPPPDAHQSSAQPDAATIAGMIPIFHPSGPFPECVVNGGMCPIPWHPKGPHVHVMHVLFNSPTANAVNTNDDEEFGSGRQIEARTGREVLEAVDGRWYCPTEEPGLAYDINAQKKRVSKLWIDDAGNVASKIWEKKLIIDSNDVYWVSYSGYQCAASEAGPGSASRGILARPKWVMYNLVLLLIFLLWAVLLYMGWGPWYSDETKNLVRTVAYTNEIEELSRDQYRTYQLSFGKYLHPYTGRNQTAILFVHGHLGSFRQGFNLAEWCTTSRDVWYTIDFSPASISAYRVQELHVQASYVALVLRTLKRYHRDVGVVAHSMGGLISELALSKIDFRVKSVHINVPWSEEHPVYVHPAMYWIVRSTRQSSRNNSRISLSSGVRDNVVPTAFTEPSTLVLSRTKDVYEDFTHVNLLFSRPVLSMFREHILPILVGDDSLFSSWTQAVVQQPSGGIDKLPQYPQHGSLESESYIPIPMEIDKLHQVEPALYHSRMEGLEGHWELTAVAQLPHVPMSASQRERGSAGDDFNTADLVPPTLHISISSGNSAWFPVRCDYLAHPARLAYCMATREELEDFADFNDDLEVRLKTDAPAIMSLKNTSLEGTKLHVFGGDISMKTEILRIVEYGPFPLKLAHGAGITILPIGGNDKGVGKQDTLLLIRNVGVGLPRGSFDVSFTVDWPRVMIETVRKGTGHALVIFLMGLLSYGAYLSLITIFPLYMLVSYFRSNGGIEGLPMLIWLSLSAAAGCIVARSLPDKRRIIPTKSLIMLLVCTPIAPSLSILISGFTGVYAGRGSWSLATVIVSYQSILGLALYVWFNGKIPPVTETAEPQYVFDTVMALLCLFLLSRDYVERPAEQIMRNED